MARTHARILTSIWGKDDWRRLSPDEQWAYFLVLSQPGLSMCGVLSYTPKRWAQLTAGSTVAKIRKAIAGLVEARFLLVDEETEELLVRTFAKNDGVLQSPNLVKAMWKAYGDVVSERLRAAFLEGLPEPFREGLPERFRQPDEKGSPPHARARAPLPQTHDPDPAPSPSRVDNPASSRLPAEDGGDDETTPEIISAAFRILAERNLERRNDELQHRGQEAITAPRRRRAWMATDIRTSEETLTKVARMYLDDQPKMTAQQLAEALDDRIVAAIASSPLAGSA